MTRHQAGVLLAYLEAIDMIGSPPEVERVVSSLEEKSDPDFVHVKKKVAKISEAMRHARNTLVDVMNRDPRAYQKAVGKPRFVARVTKR